MSQATITIDDLADGYLALTTGTTITLDRDAAGYGWFIDPTPFLSEEFGSQPGVSSFGFRVSRDQSGLTQPETRNAQLFTDSNSTPWQLFAKADGPAEGKIDLLTVLMHELGHVIGLGHELGCRGHHGCRGHIWL